MPQLPQASALCSGPRRRRRSGPRPPPQKSGTFPASTSTWAKNADIEDVAAAVDEPVGASIGVDQGCGATGAILYAICCRSSSPSESRSLLSRRRGHACSSLVVPEAGEGATLLLGYSRVSLLLPAFPSEFLCFSVFEPFFA